MKPPLGFHVNSPSHVCRLRKSLYGLKQASRQWYSKLSNALHTRGFHHSINDYSLFLIQIQSTIVIIAVYVDDILVTGNDQVEISNLKTYLDDLFKIKDLGSIGYFLGLEFSAIVGGLVAHQHKFIHELLQLYSMQDTTSVSTPLPPNIHLTTSMPNLLTNPTSYRQLIGKLNFIVHTRPNLSYAIQHLSQFNKQPS